MVIFTHHARVQMRERGITEGAVREVLSNPAETILTRANRLASYAQIRAKYIVVIHERVDSDQDLIITAMIVDHRRLLRFGFTQV